MTVTLLSRLYGPINAEVKNFFWHTHWANNSVEMNGPPSWILQEWVSCQNRGAANLLNRFSSTHRRHTFCHLFIYLTPPSPPLWIAKCCAALGMKMRKYPAISLAHGGWHKRQKFTPAPLRALTGGFERQKHGSRRA